MSKQVSPALIGSFFLAALGLVIIAIFMFGGDSIFKKNHQFVLFFHTENNLNGLNVGAPVLQAKMCVQHALGRYDCKEYGSVPGSTTPLRP